ncbi:MAG: DNA internalization-related competence protein ComEC/Rec2 [Eubacterium sp.]|nr:DNA internalization-related competence protein ComEC/Rec2 [Eubacterium sp.]
MSAYGTVTKMTKTKNAYSLHLKDVWSGEQSLGDVIVYFFDEPNVKIGNVVKVEGEFKHFDEARNPGNFDMRDYYMSLGIYGMFYGEFYEVKDSSCDYLRQGLYELRIHVKDVLNEICPKDKAEVYSAIMLGDKSDLDDNTKELYSVSGIAHILAISGLHISFIGMFFYRLLRRRFGYVFSGSISLLAVIAFAIMSGMGISTIRAVVMFGVMVLGKILGRWRDRVTSICLAGIFLCLWNPFVIFNSGFQMSFVAIIGILIVWPKVFYLLGLKDKINARELDKNATEKEKRHMVYIIIKHKIINAVLFCLNISVFMAPVIAYYYYQLPTYSFALNLIVVPLMSVVIISGVVGVLAGGLIAKWLGTILIIPGSLILDLYVALSKLIGMLPFSNIVVGKPSVYIIILYYSLILACVFFFSHRKEVRELSKKSFAKSGNDLKQIKKDKRSERIRLKRYRQIVIVLFVVLESFLYLKPIIVHINIFSSGIETMFLDVGQGDGIHIKCSDGTNIMVDGGSTTVKEVGKYRISSYLKSQCNSTIDYWFLTHGDLDHISGIIEILNNDNIGIKIKNIVLPYMREYDENLQTVRKAAKDRGIDLHSIKKGNAMEFGDTKFTCLHPTPETSSDDLNDYSIVLSVEYGKYSMLLTGDLTSTQETYLKDLKQYTLLKVGHHGSKYSSSEEFLNAIKPKIGILSSGKGNRYGHPTPEVMKRLEVIGCKYIRTDESGGISVVSDGKDLEIETYIIMNYQCK